MLNEDGDTSPRVNRARFLKGTVAVAAGSTLFGAAACGGGTAASTLHAVPRARKGGTARMAIGGVSTADNLDPLHNWDINEGFYNSAIYECLTNSDDHWNAKPFLAERWKANSNATVWTFTLRDGVRFHDGQPLTAHDAGYTISRHLDAKLGSFYYGVWAPLLDPDGIEAVDERTLVLRLKRPGSVIPYLLSAYGMEVVRAGTTDFTKTANGTGPFKFGEMTPGQSWQLERNPHYWQKGKPYLDGIRGLASPDPATKVQTVLSGTADLTDIIDFSLAKLLSGSSRAALVTQSSHFERYIAVDTRTKPFGDNRVRSAMKYAMDRPLMLSTAYLGYGTLATDVPAPTNDPYYPSTLKMRPRDVAKAKQLLAEAGYPNGIDIELHTSAVIGGLVDMCVTFAHSLEEAGIRVSLKQSSPDSYFSQVWLQVPMFATYLVRQPPGVRLAETFTKSAAFQETHLANSQVTTLTDRAYATTSFGTQKQAYGEALTYISQNEGYFDPAFSDALYARNSKLGGVVFRPSGGLSWEDMYLG